MALDPIKLGSATSSSLVFETGSRVTTSDSGIQSCSVKALCSDGANVFNNLPAAGTPFSTVFGTSYLPASFLVDYTDSGPEIEYLEGKIARVTFNFKRPDPTQLNVRKIFVDSVINYTTTLSDLYTAPIGTTVADKFSGNFGFPEPVVTVKYNSVTRPEIPMYGNLYALSGSSRAQGFPALADITVPYSPIVAVGAMGVYFDGSTWVEFGPLTVQTIFTFNQIFKPNPLGWQLVRLKTQPNAAASFYDIEEEWRQFYFFTGFQFVNVIPPL